MKQQPDLQSTTSKLVRILFNVYIVLMLGVGAACWYTAASILYAAYLYY